MSLLAVVLAWIVSIAFANLIVGIVVFSQIDKDGRILEWMREAPHWICKVAVIETWPWFLWMHLRAKR